VGLAQLGGLTQVARASFRFSRGVAFATGEEARLRGFLVPALQDDRLFVTMIGHTSQSGEASANLALSLRRAEGAAQLAQSMGLPAARLNVQGVGGAAPLAKDSDESDRAFQSRLARVDVTLQRRM